MKGLRYISDVVTLELYSDKCVGCGRCLEVCPHGVFVIEKGKARIIDRDACMECGACARNCSVRAIKVETGVGCAKGVMMGALRGTEPGCNCHDNSSKCCP